MPKVLSTIFLLPLMILLLSACDTQLEGGSPFFSPGGGGGNGGGGGGGGGTTASFFTASVKPVLQTSCTSCHSQTFRFGAPTSGIYTEATSKFYLSNGPNPEANDLYEAARGLDANHATDFCQGNSNNSPCLEIKEWYRREYGPGTGGGGGGGGGGNQLVAGRVETIDAYGEVRGSAIDPDSTAAAVSVEIYVNGPRGTGTLIGNVTANQNFGFYPGLHGFKFQLPANVRDGANRSIYVYATDLNNAEVAQLGQSPKAYKLYSPRPAGTAAYAAVITKFEQRCVGCHARDGAIFNSDSMFYTVGAATVPYFSATRMNNYIYNKASGVSHGGGNLCNGANNPCPDLLTWFDAQFN